jgi:SAM-dependent methyltransferase
VNPSLPKDPAELVRQGYNRIAHRYLQARSAGAPDLPLLAEFSHLLPPDALVLDAGCGAGVPVTQFLAQSHHVVGIDFSITQVDMAKRLVPSARFACQDMTHLGFPSGLFDGICSFYAILHVPRANHNALLADLYRLLKTPGYALLCLGAEDNADDRAPYMGVAMYWSHFDSASYLDMLTRIGFKLITSKMVPDPIAETGAHLFVLVQKNRV